LSRQDAFDPEVTVHMTNSDGQVPLPDPVEPSAAASAASAAAEPAAADAAAADVSGTGQPSLLSQLRRRAEATVARAGEWRRQLRQWVREQGIPSELLADIDLAAYEALANAAMHAYPRDTTGPMSLHAQIFTGQQGTGRIVIEVRDEGRWSDDPNRPYSEREISGRGIPLIRALTPETTVTSTVTGTHVRLAWPWAPPDPPLAPSVDG
jgi:anti-sigma regulatory factor (Ser/Thr protein kinase)